MATFGTVHHFPGGTKEQYEASIKQAHPAGGTELPEGQTYHAAGPTGDGWLVVALWDSRESWNRFRDEKLMPGLGGLGEAGFPTPPNDTAFEVHKERS